MLALLMERCLFVDFPFFNMHFEHDLDFDWDRHAARLLALGHNASAPENAPKRIASGHPSTNSFPEIAGEWMFQNVSELHSTAYGVEIWKDLDWSAALLQSNPYHKVSASTAQWLAVEMHTHLCLATS